MLRELIRPRSSFDELETLNYPMTSHQIDAAQPNVPVPVCVPTWSDWQIDLMPVIDAAFCSPETFPLGQTAKVFGGVYEKSAGMYVREQLTCTTVPVKEYKFIPSHGVTIAWLSSVPSTQPSGTVINQNLGPAVIDLIPTRSGSMDIYSVTAQYDGPPDTQSTFPVTVLHDIIAPFTVAPSVRLALLSFDTPSLVGDSGQMPSTATVDRVASPFGKAVSVSLAGADLTYPAFQYDSSPNISRNCGSVRFWFKPNWNSGSGPAGGAILFDMPYWSWTFKLTANASTIELDSNDGTQFSQFSTQINGWTAGQWHQVAITYCGGLATLYIDGTMANSSANFVPFNYPCFTSGSFRIGSAGGSLQANGTFDEVETFNYALTGEIASGYYTATHLDSDGDGIPNLTEWYSGTDPYDPDSNSDGINDGQDPTHSIDPNDHTPPTFNLLQPINALPDPL